MGDDSSAVGSARLAALRFEHVGVVLAAGILLAGLAWSRTPGADRDVWVVLAVFFATLVLWLTSAVPYTVSSVLSVTLLYALGVVDSFAEAVSGYATTLVFFLLLLLLLGAAIDDVGLDEWLAHRIVTSKGAPRRTIRSLGWNQLAVSVLVPSSVARTVTFLPIAERVADAYGGRHRESFERSAGFVLGHINPVASMAFMTGGALPIVTSELVRSTVRPVTWVEWSVFLLPPTLLLYGSSTVAASWLYSGDAAEPESSVGPEPASEMGPPETERDVAGADAETGPPELGREQKTVAGVMLATIAAWIGGSFVGLPTIVPAAVAVAVLALPNVRIVTERTVAEVSWGILFLVGAMFSILDAMRSTGAIDLVVRALTGALPLAGMADWQVVVALLATTVVLRLFFSVAPAALVVILPVVFQFAQSAGVDRLFLAFSVMILMITPTFVPFNTMTVLITYDEGLLTARDVATFGAVTLVLAAVTIAFGWLVYWPLVT